MLWRLAPGEGGAGAVRQAYFFDEGRRVVAWGDAQPLRVLDAVASLGGRRGEPRFQSPDNAVDRQARTVSDDRPIQEGYAPEAP